MSLTADSHSPSQQRLSSLSQFYEQIAVQSLTPLWKVLHRLVPTEPSSPCLPAGWHYQDVRPYLMEAGDLITAKEAERRVLILENPGMKGQSCITQTLYAGLQVLLPGEIAPSHRHTQSALRLVLEGGDAYTAVDGERIPMSPGDLIITPSMTWHDHGNTGSAPVVWLDGLDIPLLRMLDAGFAEKYPQETHPITRPEGHSAAQFGSNLAPIDHVPSANRASPLCIYAFSNTRAALHSLRRAGPPDPYHGYAQKFLHPTTGGPPVASIGCYVSLLPQHFSGSPYRSTDGRVFCCLEGEGRIDTNDWSFEFGARDVFVVPSWIAYQLVASTDTIVFSFSDRPVQQALGLWREEPA